MAQSEIRVKLGFDADITKAKQQITELQTSLQKVMSLTTANVKHGTFSKELQEASLAAAQLQVNIAQAFNQNTGKLDLSKFNAQMKQSGMSLEKYQTLLSKAGVAGRESFMQLAKSITTAEIPLIRINDTLAKFGTTLANTVRWQASASLLQGFTGAISKAYGYAQDLNKSLNDIRIVTKYSVEEMDKFAEKANKAAKALSTTTTEYTNASLIYYQQGLSEAEIEKRTELTIKMANVTGESAKNVSDQLTAVWNNFYDGTKSLEHYVDVMTALGAATASSTDEISEGLNKFAAVAETVGLSYEYAASALATVTATTRESADVVGNAFKTLFARIQGLRLGETLDDGTTLNKYSKALESVGISIFEQNGQMKEMNNILDEMGSKWTSLSKDQQVALAQTVAGVRQYTQLVALMDNWNYFQKNLGVANTSSGALQEQADIYAESWQAARDRVTASLESIYDKLLNDEAFIDILNFLNSIIEGFNTLLTAVGGLEGALGIIGSTLIGVFQKQAASGIVSVIDSFRGLTVKGRQELEDEQKKASVLLGKGYGSDKIGTLQGQAAQSMADANIAFLQSSKDLNESQRTALELVLKRKQALAEAAIEQGNEAKEAEKTANIAKRRADIQFQNTKITNGETGQAAQVNAYKALGVASEVRRTEHAGELDWETGEYSDSWAEETEVVTQEAIIARKKALAQQLQEKSSQTSASLAIGTEIDTASDFKALSEGSTADSSTQMAAIEELKKRLEGLGATANIASQELQELVGKDIAESMRAYSASVSEAEAATKELLDIDNEIASVQKKGGQVFAEMSNKRAAALEKQKTKLKDVASKENEYRKKVQNSAEETQKAHEALAGLGETEAANNIQATGEAMGELAGQAAIAAGRVVGADEDIRKGAEDLKNVSGPQKLAETMTGLVSTVTAVTATFSIFKGIIDTWNNTDLSFGEKLLSTITALGTAVPMLTQAFDVQNNALMKLITTKMLELAVSQGILGAETAENIAKGLGISITVADAAATTADTGAKTANTAATWLQTAANWALNASISPLLIIIVLITAAIGALALIIWGVVSAFKAWQASTPEAKLKALEERAEESAEAFNKVSEAVDKVNESLNQIQNAYSTIENLTAGTTEWYQAIADVNAQVLKLLETYPELINYISQEDGIIKLNQAGVDYVREQENIRLSTAYNVAQSDQRKVLEQKSKDLSKNYGAEMFAGENYEKNWAIVQGYYEDPRVGESMFTEAGAKALVDAIYGDEEYHRNQYYEGYEQYGTENYNHLVEAMQLYLEQNRETIEEIAQVNEQIRLLEDTQFEGKLSAIGSIRNADQGRDLLQGQNYTDIVATQRKKVSGTFGDWNDHSNYNTAWDTSDEEWKMIEDFMKLQGDSVKYIAQRHGKMVLEVDGKEIEYDKDKVYDTLAEYYASDDLKQQLTANLKETLSESMPNLDLSNLTDKQIIGLDNLQITLQNSLDGVKGLNADLIFEQVTQSFGTNIEQFEQFATSLSAIDWNTDNIRELNEAALSLNEGTISVQEFANVINEISQASILEGMNSFFSQAASSMGLGDEEATEMHDYAKNLMEIANEAENLSDELSSSASAAADLAVEITRMNKGVETLSENFEEWNDILLNSSETSAEYSKAMSGMKKGLADILDVEADFISNDFVTEHLDKIKLAAEGSAEAIDFLRSQMDEEIIAKVSIGKTDEVIAQIKQLDSELQNLINTEYPDIEIGATIQDADFLAAANKLVDKAGMTADEANAYFAGISYEPVYSETEISTAATMPNGQTKMTIDSIGSDGGQLVDLGPLGSINLPSITYRTTSVPADPTKFDTSLNLVSFSGDKKAPAPIRGLRKKATGSMNNASSVNKGGNNSGGGGGGSKKAPKNAKKEAGRYHEVKEVIDDLSRQYDKISKAKDRAFGADKLALIDAEIAATERLIDTQEQYLKEIEANRKLDKEKLAEYGASFDEMGRITNYDEMYEANVKQYNEALEKVNAGNMSDKQFEEYEKEFDEFVDDIAQYEETLNLLEDEETNLLNLQNQLFDAKIASITYKVELDTRLADNEIAYLEYQFENLSDSIDDTALSLVNLGKQTEQNLKKVESYQTGIKEMLSLSGFSDQDIETILNGTEDISTILQSKTLTDEQISTLEEYRDALMDVNTQMSEMRKQVHEELIAAFEEMNEEMNREVEAIDHFSDMLQSYRDIIDLVGKDNMGISNAMLQEMSRANVENASAALRSQKAILDANKSALAEAEASLAKAREANQEEDIKLWEETVRTLSETVTSGEEELMSRWQSALQAAADAFSDAVDQVMEDFEKAMTGVAGGFDALQEKYNQQKEINDRYLDDYQKIYELSKLNRDITKSIDDTDNIRAKTRLRDIQEEINALQESNTEMTQYEVNELRARYELRLAEIALEEAQNAKNQVRMSRDAEGNWSYVYTANQENVDNAMQNYEDKLYAYQTLTQERAEEIEEQILALPKEFSEAIQEIMMDLTLTEEEKEQKIFDTRKYYEDKYNYLLGQISISLNDAKRLYENDWQAFSQATGYKISDAEEWQDKFDETILAQLTGYTNIEEAQAKFNTATDDMFSDLLSAYKQYKIDTDNIMSEVAIDAEVFTEKITDGTQEAADSIKSLADAAAEGFGSLVDWVNWYANEYGTEIQKYISENDKMITSINSILEKLGKVPSALSQAEAAARQAVEEAQAKEAEIDTIVSSGGGSGWVPTEPPVQEPETKYWRVMYDADGKDKNQATPTVYKTGKYLNAIDALNAAREKYISQKMRMDPKTSRQEAEQNWLNARAAGFYIAKQYIYKAPAGGVGGGKPPTMTQFDSGSNGLLRLNTGGYTGEWGTEGRIAMLHQKELVLNADDTTNFLSAIKIIRDISRVIDLRATAQQSALNAMTSSTVAPMAQILQQEVTIHAEFPNATQRTEIEAAFDTLLNRASQFANRKNQ